MKPTTKYKHLTQLGKRTPLPASPDAAVLETVPNTQGGALYLVRFTCPEFTALCPMTGQPDFATFTITYVPDKTCVELKSLKLYLWSFRDEGHFHEDVTNVILNDLVKSTDPRKMTIVGRFNVRGGIGTTVTVRYPA